MSVKDYANAGTARMAARLAMRGPGTVNLELSVNGTAQLVSVEPRVSLLDLLREQLDLTGTTKGCDHGTCGACTVWVDGRRVLSCLTLAITCEDRGITTTESLAKGAAVHPMQQAFITHDAFQCGYCTPGQIMSAVALPDEGHASNDAEIREWMRGNICRCAVYPNIRAAIRQVRDAAGAHHNAAVKPLEPNAGFDLGQRLRPAPVTRLPRATVAPRRRCRTARRPRRLRRSARRTAASCRTEPGIERSRTTTSGNT